MKKYFTYVVLKRALKILPAKVFFLAILFCCKGSDSYATAWTTGTAGAINTLSNWTDGTTSPTSFTTPGDTWTVTMSMTIAVSATWVVGTSASTPVIVIFATGGALDCSGGGSSVAVVNIYGDVIVSGGAISRAGSGSTGLTLNVYGKYSMSSGNVTRNGSGSGFVTLNIHGNYTQTGGTIISSGSSSPATGCVVNAYGNYSVSGPSAMTNTGAGTSSTVHLLLPSASGTMLVDNTSTGTWSGTNIYVDAGCTAQLDGNFSTTTGSAAFGLTVNGTLICPAADTVTGTRLFALNSGATLKVAHTTGINGAIATTGTTTFNTSANYAFIGSAAQVTGSYLPVALITPDTITISNSAGVTLTASTATTGKLLFTSGILHTGTFTMSTPGAAGLVVGAGAGSYVHGTLIKTVSSLTFIDYEVGDFNYAPMNLAIPVPMGGGSIGVMSTYGLHPSVGTSGILATNIANHYWTITTIGTAGGATIIPKAIYNLPDIIGGSNAGFVAQEYRAAAWLGAPLASTNTSVPYTSATAAGIGLATLPGDYIFGSDCATPLITGVTTLCVGTNTPLSDAATGGTWSSNNTSIATVSPTGVVFGVAAGTCGILYATSCAASVAVTVGTAPITGATTLCPATTSFLSDATPGGTWSSDNTLVATVSGTGLVSGLTGGTANISYSFGGCAPVIVGITVGAIAPITGGTAVCTGSTLALSDATASGTWSSGSPSVATVSTTGVVTGLTSGTAVITYSNASCSATTTITVSPLASITGSTSICAIGGTTSLSDATSGGTWSSSNTGVATVAGGSVTAASTGTTVISYAVGSCSTSVSVTVGAMSPIITPTGTSICTGSNIAFSDATAGGTWSSSNTTRATVSGTGVVYGVTAGTATISYTSGGCSAVVTVTVTSLSAISGTTTVCAGSSSALSDAASGGVWSSSNTGIATISTSGVIYGATAGTSVISYVLGSCSASTTVTVSGSLSPITGPTSVCVGSTIALSDATAGGVWSSSNTTRATVSGGVVGGVSAGAVTITYAVGSCNVTYSVSVGSLPPITGTTAICVSTTTALSDATGGGVWSSSNVSVATVSGIGVVFGTATAGTTVITYTVGSCIATTTVTVGSLTPITNSTGVCVGSSITLSDATPGGVWSSGTTTAATVSATGVVTGVASGSATIYYTLGPCTVSTIVSVGVAVASITGPTAVCTGSTIGLSDATPGGTWSSSNTAVITVTGNVVVHGVSTGTSIISYTVGGCSAGVTVTVDPNNGGVITGKDSVCAGAGHEITLSDFVSGGVWSSTNTSRATVDPVTGVVTGVYSGTIVVTDTIKYTVTNSCGTFTVKKVIYLRKASQCATGIGPVAETVTELKVFPNPNGGIFTVNLLSDIDEEVHIVITNIIGEKVREIVTTTNKATDIKLAPASGIYLLSATTVHGRYITKIVIN